MKASGIGEGVRVEVSWIFSFIESEMRGGSNRNPSPFTRAVNSVFAFVRFSEFEILIVLFIVIAFIIFKDLTSRPEYNQILVKKPGGPDWWPY